MWTLKKKYNTIYDTADTRISPKENLGVALKKPQKSTKCAQPLSLPRTLATISVVKVFSI